ncbi:MAG: gluconate 2-dehydrogenase subunit 3 family protein [Gammaproteobacteria bacterium]
MQTTAGTPLRDSLIYSGLSTINQRRLVMERRDFVKRALSSSSLLLAFQLGGATVLLSPREARAKQVPFNHLAGQDVQLLQQLLDLIVPGAVQAGTVHFIDQQLGVEPDDCLLILKFFELPPPYSNFYTAGFDAIRRHAQEQFGRDISALTAAQKQQLLQYIATPEQVDAAGFPIFLFYLCLRSDAVDMVYGTPEGFEKLNIPYMAHIMPPENRRE